MDMSLPDAKELDKLRKIFLKISFQVVLVMSKPIYQLVLCSGLAQD